MPSAAIALDLGHDLPVPEPPQGLFGAPRFTAEQQAANPSAPYTRVIKDILHVGTRRVRDEANGDRLVDWTITEDLMRALVDAHSVGRSRGVPANLGKTHGDKATRLIHPNDLIAPIGELKVANGILWASMYVTPENAAYLSNPALKVSPYIVAGWRDTGGHLYPAKVLHVAVTDNPVIPGQGPFRIALCDPVSKREVPMSLKNVFRLPRKSKPLFAVALAEGDEEAVIDDEVTDVEEGTNEIDGDGVETLIEQVATLLDAAYGLALPEATDGTNLVDRLAMLLDVASQLTAPEETAEETAVEGAGAVAMSNGRRVVRKSNPRVKLALRKAEQRGERRARYEYALDEAGKAGVSADVIEAKRILGKQYGYDPRLIAELPTSVPMGNPLGKHLKTAPPSVSRAPKMLTEDEIKANTDRILRRVR